MNLETFAATEFNKIVSGIQLPLDVEGLQHFREP